MGYKCHGNVSWSNPLDTLLLQYSSTPNRMGGAMLELVGHWTGPRKYASREGQFQYQLVNTYTGITRDDHNTVPGKTTKQSLKKYIFLIR